MFVLTRVFVGLVAVLHLGFMFIEMFLFKRPAGQRIFGITPEFATEAAPMAANQGLYNGFLVAGLVWGLLLGASPFAFQVQVFFLSCVVIAGVFGALTVSGRIMLIQAVPAAIALGLVLTTHA